MCCLLYECVSLIPPQDLTPAALTSSVATGDLEALTAALAAGADATAVLPEYRYDGRTYEGVNLVQVAALHGHVAVVGPLVRAGAHLDHQTTGGDLKGSTALHLTVLHHDHPEMLRQLAALGLNVDTTNHYGK